MPWHISKQDDKFCIVKDDTDETVTCHDTMQQAKDHLAALYANEPSAAKSGRKISRANMTRIQQIADHAYAMGAKPPAPDSTPMGKADMSLADRSEAVWSAVQMQNMQAANEYPYIEDIYDSYVIINIGDTCYRADYSLSSDGAVTLAARDAWVEVEEVWQPVAAAAAKAGLLLQDSQATHYASIKALGDRRIEVLVSYYGHKNGKDSHGEYFSPRTDFAVEDFPTPPLLYYHGYDENNRKMSKPIVTGKMESRRNTPKGHALIYKLKSGKYADLQWESSLKGECVVSPGTVGHLIRPGENGELLYWPLAEVSAWDYSDKRKPANLHSVAAPILKALYLAEGLTLPTSIATANDPKPETPGDGVSAGDPHADVSPDEAARMVTSEIVAALLTRNKRIT